MPFVVNYDGDWVKSVTGNSVDYDELTSDDVTTNINDALLFKDNLYENAEKMIDRLVRIGGYNKDAFDVVQVAIVPQLKNENGLHYCPFCKKQVAVLRRVIEI